MVRITASSSMDLPGDWDMRTLDDGGVVLAPPPSPFFAASVLVAEHTDPRELHELLATVPGLRVIDDEPVRHASEAGIERRLYVWATPATSVTGEVRRVPTTTGGFVDVTTTCATSGFAEDWPLLMAVVETLEVGP